MRLLFLLLLISTKALSQNYDFSERNLKQDTANLAPGLVELRSEYSTLINTRLVNVTNRSRLRAYQKDAKNFLSDLPKLDLSKPENVSFIASNINKYRDDRDISEELRAVSVIKSELAEIRKKHPEDFSSSQRYKELQTALDSISTCDPDDIQVIAIKYGLY